MDEDGEDNEGLDEDEEGNEEVIPSSKGSKKSDKESTVQELKSLFAKTHAKAISHLLSDTEFKKHLLVNDALARAIYSLEITCNYRK